MVRVFALARELAKTRRGVSYKELAERLDVSRRSLYRDRDYLSEIGFAIVEVAPSRWKLAGDPREHTWLDGARRDELLALFVAQRFLGSSNQLAMGRALARLWRRLTDADRPQLLATDEVPLSVGAGAPLRDPAPEHIVATLEAAVKSRRCVQLRYRRPESGAISERVVEPGFLHAEPSADAVYFVAWCRLRDDVRYFAVHRVVSVALLDEKPTPRPALAAANRSAAFRLWWRDRVKRVVLRFSVRAAGGIRERTWHPSQTLADTPDGGVQLTLDVAAPEELERWLLGFAADVEVIEPTWLAELLRERHAAALALPVATSIAPNRYSAKRARALSPGDNDAPQDVRQLLSPRSRRLRTNPSDR